MKKRNGKIELLRFLFCVVIMLHHIGLTLGGEAAELGHKLYFFKNGYIGVEFFFLVSGYLLAASALKAQNSHNSLSKDSVEFMRRKVFALLPWWVIVFASAFVVATALQWKGIKSAVYTFIDSVPNFLYLQTSGIHCKELIGVTWYISAMLFAMAIIYPLCRKYYQTFTRIVSPLVSLFIVGYLAHTTGAISEYKPWIIILQKGVFRAIAEICLGVFLFEVVRYAKNFNFSKAQRVALTVLELALVLATLYFASSTIKGKYEPYVLAAIAVVVALAFSGITYGEKLTNNSFVYFLGKLTLPLYLWQSVTRKIVGNLFTNLSYTNQVLLFFALTLAVSLVFLPLEKVFAKSLNSTYLKLTKQLNHKEN